MIIISGGLKTYPNDFDKIALIKNFIDTASESQGQSPNNVRFILSIKMVLEIYERPTYKFGFANFLLHHGQYLKGSRLAIGR